MWLARYLPTFSGLNESSLSTSSPCKNCIRKRWLLNTEGLLAAGGICLGSQVALKGQSQWTKAALTTGTLCICLVNSVLLHFPVARPSSWMYLLTGGMLAGAGIGWCLTVAFKEQSKSTIVAYMAGAISICLTNSIMFHVPSCNESTQKVSKSVALQPDEKNSQIRVRHHDCRDGHGRLISLTAKDVEDIAQNMQSGGKQCHKCNGFFEEMAKPGDGTECEELSVCATEVPTNTGLQQNRTGVKEKRIIKRESMRRKRAIQRQREMLTCESRSGNVAESLDSHRQIEMQPDLPIPSEFNVSRMGDEPTFFLVKTDYKRSDAPRVYYASRFQEIDSTVDVSTMAGDEPPPNEGYETVKTEPPTEGSGAVVPKDEDEYSGDGTTNDDAVGVESVPTVTGHSRKSEDMPICKSLHELAKEAATIDEVSVGPSQSADERPSVEN